MNRKIMHIKLTEHNNLHTDVETYFDYESNVIHVLDRYALDSGKTVTNAIEYYIRPYILKEYNLLNDNVRWLIYPTDGFISEFTNFEPFEGSGNFVSVPDNDPIIYKPFKEIMENINEVRGYLEYFKEATYENKEEDINNALSYLPKTNKLKEKLTSIKQELLEIFCGVESKDSERKELVRLVKEKMQGDLISNTSEMMKKNKEKIINGILAYLVGRYNLIEPAILYKTIEYLLNNFASVYYSSKKDKLCEKVRKQD